jgi:hypothetical protein
MDEDYLNLIYKYYNNKNSNKKCKNCISTKTFKEKNNKIIYSCGDSTDRKCGIQLDIDLPEFINYNHIHEITKFINEKINSKVLSNYIDIPIDDYSEEVKNINNIDKLYNKQNNIISKKEIMNDILLKRKRLYAKLDINEPKLYAKNMKDINKYYNELIELINHITDIIITIEPKINKNLLNSTTISNSNNLKVKWTDKQITRYGYVIEIIKDDFFIFSGDNEYMIKKGKIQIINEKEYNDSINEDKLNIGDRVDWYNKSNILMSGDILDINNNNVIIRDDDNDEYVIPISKLKK